MSNEQKLPFFCQEMLPAMSYPYFRPCLRPIPCDGEHLGSEKLYLLCAEVRQRNEETDPALVAYRGLLLTWASTLFGYPVEELVLDVTFVGVRNKHLCHLHHRDDRTKPLFPPIGATVEGYTEKEALSWMSMCFWQIAQLQANNAQVDVTQLEEFLRSARLAHASLQALGEEAKKLHTKLALEINQEIK